MPWPSNFFRSLSLHGVKVVAGPSPIQIGGVKGTTITVMTLAMHPLVWVKGDSAWLGGGRTGLDPAEVRQIILLQVNGRKLLLSFPDVSQNFSSRQLKVNDVWKSITFSN